jgi:hypothetical protein
MSHFTVLVIGENPEEQLKPFDENLRTEFEDKTEEYRKDYETEKVNEFYCASHSSWGMQITQELFETLKKSKIGRVVVYDVTKLDPMSYMRSGKKYRGYYAVDGNKRSKGTQWFEVDEVLSTTHPDSDVCFEGTVRVRKIRAPKEILLKDRYATYEEYLKEWHGVDDINHQGYDYNPKAKWDWYQLGGRWTGFFKLKPRATGVLGNPSLVSSKRAEIGTSDQARKKDIDFEKMAQEQFEEAAETYDKFEEEYKKGGMTSSTGYFDYNVHNLGKDADHYVPESRELYLKRHAAVGTFAVLKDGEWYEKGNMGWWGFVSDEKNPDEWNDQFNKLITELPEDTLLSVYDCHI